MLSRNTKHYTKYVMDGQQLGEVCKTFVVNDARLLSHLFLQADADAIATAKFGFQVQPVSDALKAAPGKNADAISQYVSFFLKE